MLCPIIVVFIVLSLMISKGIITADELNAEAEKVTNFINDQAKKIMSEDTDENI